MAGKINGESTTNCGQKSRNWSQEEIGSWNEVIEKANYENRKKFRAFVGRTSKASRKGIASLRSSSGS